MYDGLGTQEIELRSRPFRSVMDVKRAVAKRYGVTVADLEGECTQRKFTHPRHIAMAIAYRRLKPFGYSLPMVAKHFGDRHHTVVLFANRKLGTKGRLPQGRRGPTRVQRAKLDQIGGAA